MSVHKRRPGDLSLGRVIGTNESYRLPRQDRNKHLYVCGGTGAGKSKFIERLIRQDIVDWHDTHEGLLLIDPEGPIFDGLMAWLADEGIGGRFDDVPIVPIEVGQDEYIAGYNWLRQREAETSVIVGNLVTAIAHVWGAGGTDATPRFEQQASIVLRALYEKRLSLVEAVHLIDPIDERGLRRFLTSRLSDPIAAKGWAFNNSLSATKLDERTESTLNRFARFLRAEIIRASLGQIEQSFDMRQAMDEGHIVLVSLSRKGAKIQPEDAQLYATLLLADLWTAAEERGAPDDENDVQHFNVYVDEFTDFVTPDIARQLRRARKYGVCVTIAQQFPGQLLAEGENGRQTFGEVMETASSKVVFRLQNTDNLKPLADQLFFGTFNADEVKFDLMATRVLGQVKEKRYSVTTGESEAEGHSHVEAHSSGRTSSSMAGSGISESESADAALDPTGTIRAWNETYCDATAESETWSEAHGSSRSSTSSRSVTESVADVNIFGKELAGRQYRSLEEQSFRGMQKLFIQQVRQCAVRLVGRAAPVFLQTFDITPGTKDAEQIARHMAKLRSRWSFFLSLPEARKRIEARETKLLATVVETPTEEVTTTRRRVTH